MDNSNTPSGLTMQTDDLPPLPEPRLYAMFDEAYTAEDMHEYARAHAAALQAENDKLRADAERLGVFSENVETLLSHIMTKGIARREYVACAKVLDQAREVRAARAAITGDKG